MKILHTSDLHIGMRIKEFSMHEDQLHILNEIIRVAQKEQPQAIILAGDIYDKSVPSAEAVSMLDDFMVRLSKLNSQVFIISGNHDSAERLSFASLLIKQTGIYLAPVYNGKIEPIVIDNTAFYMIPFIKPATVRYHALSQEQDPEKQKELEKQICSYDAAMRYVIDHMEIDPSRTNILITHQFITNSERSDSEDSVIGGLDNIDSSAFDKFDYVALGHLHRPQSCGRDTIRYSGTPMKYSFSEVNDSKSVTIIETSGKDISLRFEPLVPLREWYDLRGTYSELMAKDYYEGKGYQEAWVRITLTDQEEIPDAKRRLDAVYHRIMELSYDNLRTRSGAIAVGSAVNPQDRKPADLFAELYEKQNSQPLSEEQKKYLDSLIDNIWKA